MDSPRASFEQKGKSGVQLLTVLPMSLSLDTSPAYYHRDMEAVRDFPN